ncbi:ankyrin repeat and SOCS box protein 2-like [Corythoichthys intestinalis]|uniref:ankyrin repeat and SOCS box protein 2-like n=1 Tax=Corythoichthys intestinalis TaxID=161448 RepID=UPI0025A5911E|nr:ankyrin repeat and SOCS box protein 2-like [Corythoichthys intestinalis]XP_061806351.1 ankyrin repeat and SOCS box protein 2-like [Nerophis lumbriciformis]
MANTPELDDYSAYASLTDEELLQLAVERSLAEACLRPLARAPDPKVDKSQQVEQGPAHYSSPNPPAPKPPDLGTFEGTVSRFTTGAGMKMLAYRKLDGTLVHVVPEPEEEEEPIFRAIRAGDTVRLKALITASGGNPMLPAKPGWLAIHQAAWLNREACLRVLLTAQPGMVNERSERGETPLLVAVSGEHSGCAGLLLENGADPNVADREHETPLYKACEKDNPALVALLLNHGAAVDAKCFQGWTALHEAACRDNVEICQMLLKAGGKHSPRDNYGITPLFTAAQGGRLASLRLLVKHGADINSQAEDGAAPLHEAAKNGHADIVEFLLSQKADANIAGKAGLLPLHIAARKGSETIVSMLIPATSKARVRRTGISPLHVAAEHNRDEVLELLIRAGFDVNARLSEERSRLYEDRRGTALYLAVDNYNVDNVRSLLEAGADPNLDVFGPLLVAARQGCAENVALLVEHGADVNARIATRPTDFPAVFLFTMKYLPMFKYLLDNGGDALSCFRCAYGSGPHPPLQTGRSHPGHLGYPETRRPLGGGGARSVQFCEVISAPSISRWAGPILDVLLDYVGHVKLCSRLVEHLDSYDDWSVIKEKAALPRRLLQLCRVRVVQLAGRHRLKSLPLPGTLIRFLLHREASVTL